MNRRKFIHSIGIGTGASVLGRNILPFLIPAGFSDSLKPLTFGIVADVHKDLMPDADQRLETFIDKAIDTKVDFIIQMGDFCFGESKNKGFLKIWETFKGPRFHVLGNHDMDRNSKVEMLDFWGMPKTYYSYDKKGYHFIVLDANFLYKDSEYVDYKNSNFYVDSKIRTFINEEQIEWFQADLESSTAPTIVFCHQSLWHGVKNRAILQKIMEDHHDKIICSLNAHNHTDYHYTQNGIDYIGINSMSYQWVSGKYESKERFSKELYKEYGNLHHIAAYKEPLFAFASLDPKGAMIIEGAKSDWVSPSPFQMNDPENEYNYPPSIQISDYHIQY